jgi:anti-sigma B factor antagonist
MALAISVGDAEVISVVAVDGELDMMTAPQLLEAAVGLADAGHTRLVLDLGKLTFCDSAGLSVLARVLRRVDADGGALALARPEPMVRSVLDLTGMSDVIEIYPTVAEARAAVGG